jgi:DNA polymerase III epsilon subunit-like protein
LSKDFSGEIFNCPKNTRLVQQIISPPYLSGNAIFHSLVRPAFNRLPRPTKDQRFNAAEFEGAPYWDEAWESIAPLVDNKLLIAYNTSFECRALAAECVRHRLTSEDLG